MARIRSIKPEFWTDPDIVAMPMEARLFFVGCWNHADDYGVLRDDPARLKLQIMPADQIDAEAIVDELVRRRHLSRMIAPDGTRVLVVRTFCVHQKIDRRAAGRWGTPDQFTTAEAHLTTPDPDQSPPIPTTPTPGREGKGGEGKGREVTPVSDVTPLDGTVALSVPPLAAGQVERVFAAWQEATGHRQATLDEKRRRLIRAAIKSHGIDTAVAAVSGVRWSPFHMGDNDRGKRYDSLGLILRDADKIEEFARYERDPASRPQRQQRGTKSDATRAKLAAALERMEGHHTIEATAS